MAKRSATKELNHDNWNEEDEPEESGMFRRAEAQELQSRAIKNAKRRMGSSCLSNPETQKSLNPFSGLSGFGSDSSKALFTLGGKANNMPSSEATSSSQLKPRQNSFTFDSRSMQQHSTNNNSLDDLKQLNLSCSKWISEHLVKNPFIILTPIFKDYENYLSKLELDKLDSKTSQPSKVEATFAFPFQEKSDRNGPGAVSESKLNNLPAFSFAKIAQPLPSTNDQQVEDEDPPDSNFVPVLEEDSLFDMRCKVFVKKDGEFTSKGVGRLFLKAVQPSGKTQLIVRADTSIGNILVNILLSASLPIQKMGSNNVLLVCLPTPETQPPPVPVLLRVKTQAERDTLLSKLEECRAAM